MRARRYLLRLLPLTFPVLAWAQASPALPSASMPDPGAVTSSGPPLFVIVISLLQVFVMVAPMFLVWKLWAAILQFVSTSTTEKVDGFTKLLGGFVATYSTGSVKAVGVGITLVILVVALGAVWILGQNNAT